MGAPSLPPSLPRSPGTLGPEGTMSTTAAELKGSALPGAGASFFFSGRVSLGLRVSGRLRPPNRSPLGLRRR